MKFEFHPAKSASNKVKHGLDFVEAQALWSDGNHVRVQAKTVAGEIRYAELGTIKGQPYTVIVTYRKQNIRIISARPSSPVETRIYEQHKNKVP